jgi:hypothetical protein
MAIHWRNGMRRPVGLGWRLTLLSRQGAASHRTRVQSIAWLALACVLATPRAAGAMEKAVSAR